MGKVIGYARVSTTGQAEQGISLEAQVAKIRAYCVANDLGEPEIVVDGGASAKNLHRDGMASILEAVKRREVEAFVVAKIDRATRSVRDLYELVERFQRAGVAFHSIAERVDTTSATGRAFLGLLGVMSQLERELIGERTATALRHLRATGKVYGSTPFGFERVGDELIPSAGDRGARPRPAAAGRGRHPARHRERVDAAWRCDEEGRTMAGRDRAPGSPARGLEGAR